MVVNLSGNLVATSLLNQVSVRRNLSHPMVRHSYRQMIYRGGNELRPKALWASGVASLILMAGPAVYAASLQQLQQAEAQAQAQLASEQNAYNTTQSQINQTMSAISSLNQSLGAAKNKIGSTNQQIAITTQQLNQTQALLNTTQNQLNATQQQLTATEATYNKTTALLKRTKQNLVREGHLFNGQLRLIEEHGSIGYLDVLLGAHSFADFVSRLTLLGQIASAAAHEVRVIHAEEQQEALEKKNLASEAKLLSATQASLNKHKAMLQQARAMFAQEQQRSVYLHGQAVAQAQQMSTSLHLRQSLANRLQAQKGQLSQAMAALGNQIAAIASQIQALVSKYNQGFLSRKALFNAMLPLVKPIAGRYGLSPALVIAVITEESGGNASIVSPAGAVGLMQLEPGTAAYLGVNPNNLTNPQTNLIAGCLYLHDMLGLFGQNLSLALSAYNAGPGSVQNNGDRVVPATWGYVNNIESMYNTYSQWLASGA